MMQQDNSAMTSYLTVMCEIHVLLVDHDRDGLMNAVNLLQMCEYKVTFVELASVAMSMLSSGKAKFDIVMANINSPDLHGYKLMQQAVNMDLPIILMSVEDNPFVATKAIQNGAYMYIKKPATLEMLRYLWQHVTSKEKRDEVMAANYNARGIAFRNSVPRVDIHPNSIVNGVRRNNVIAMDITRKFKRNVREIDGFKHEDDEEYGLENHNVVINKNRLKKKACTEWTKELHDKFMDAVEQLGEGRCFPKEIVARMNVPGLTRMQVASHLQKCRNENWRSPEERKSQPVIRPISTDTNGPEHKPRKFGSMPQLGKASSSYNVQEIISETGEGSQAHTPNSGEVENDGTGSIMTSIVSRNQHYGPIVPYSNNVTPTTSHE